MPALDTIPNGPVAFYAVTIAVKKEQPRAWSFEGDRQPEEELRLECGSRWA